MRRTPYQYKHFVYSKHHWIITAYLPKKKKPFMQTSHKQSNQLSNDLYNSGDTMNSFGKVQLKGFKDIHDLVCIAEF